MKQTLHSWEYQQCFGATCGQQGETTQFLPLCLQGPEIVSELQRSSWLYLHIASKAVPHTICPKGAMRRFQSEKKVQLIGKYLMSNLSLLRGHCWHVSGTRTIKARVRRGTIILFLVAHVLLQAVLPPLYTASKFVFMPLPACHSAPNCIPCPIQARLKVSSSAGQSNRVHMSEP